MKSRNKHPADTSLSAKSIGQQANLRQQAETSIQAKRGHLAQQTNDLSPEALQTIFHELHVHQIELELQNEELRQAQTELVAAKARYFDLYDLAPVGYLSVCKNDLINQANLAASTLLGLPRRELVNKRLSYFIVNDDLDRYDQFRKLAFESNKHEVVNLRMLNHGAPFWGRLEAIAAEESASLRITLTNITELIQAEAALHESDAFKQTILNSISSQIAVLDCDGVIIAVNESWRRFALDNSIDLDVPARHTQVGSNYLEICKADINSESSEYAQKAYEGVLTVLEHRQLEFSFEYACHSPDQQRWFIANITPLSAERDGVVITHADITDRKQAERLLSKFKAMADLSIDGFWIVDLKGNMQHANKAYVNMTGYSLDELVGMNISQLEAKENIEQLNSHLLKIAKLGSDHFETKYRHKDGHEIDTEVFSTFLPEFQHITAFCRDITERNHLKQQDQKHLDELAHITRMGLVGEMASGIAHEVNQPLAAISSYAQVSLNLINEEHPDLVKLAEILSKTQQQALRAGQIIHRMKNFAKSHGTNHSSADVNALIHDAVNLCNAEFKQNSIKVTFKLGDNLPPVFVDKIQIEQVIINLIRNSVEAMQNLIAKQQQPHIIIQSQLIADNFIQVNLKDNGPGFDQDLQQKILMPFFTTKTQGMGMGLSISRSLIEAHGGTLHFQSKPGKGATFYFTLPVDKEKGGSPDGH
jgi:PAS domain S-box-containing protein